MSGTFSADVEDGSGAGVRPARVNARSDRRIFWGIFLVLVGIYGLTAGGHTYSSDEEGMFATAESLVEDRDPILSIDGRNDRVIPVTSGRDGQVVTFASFGPAVVAMPLVVAGKLTAVLLPAGWGDYTTRLFVGWMNSIITAFGGALLYLAARRLGATVRAGAGLAFVYALATMVWPHAKTSFGEPLVVTLVLASLYWALRARDGDRLRNVAISGVWAAVALFSRPSAGLFAPLICAYLVCRLSNRKTWFRDSLGVVLSFGAGSLVPLIGFLVSNWWRFGSPTDMGYPPLKFDYPIFEGLYGLFLSPGKGLVFYAPIAIVGMAAALFCPRRYRLEVALLMAMGVVNALFFARYHQWHGDHSWGPRYMFMSLPFLTLAVAPVLARVAWRRAAAGAAIVGIVPTFLGVGMYFNQYFHIAETSIGYQMLDDGPSYWKPLHFDPYWSPIAGHIRALPDVARNTGNNLDGGAPAPASPVFPVDESQVNSRYGWYFLPPQGDSWMYWIFPTHAPKRLLLLAFPFILACGFGGWRLRRGLSESRVR